MKCPACGYNSYNTDYRNEIMKLLNKRNKTTSNMLKKTIHLIIKYIPSDKDNKKAYYFLQGISKISDRIVTFGLNQYHSNNYVVQLKGFSYLRSIIINIGANNKKKIYSERKRFGTLPREINL